MKRLQRAAAGWLASLLLVSPLAAQVDADSAIVDLESVAADVPSIDPSDESERAARATWTISARWPFERRSGFLRSDSTSFLGPSVSLRSRLTLQIGDHVRAGFVVDKDSGEPFGRAYAPFDFQTAFVSLQKLGPISEIILGALRPRFGLGLMTWVGQRISRLGSSISSTGTPRSTIQPNASTDETVRLDGVSLDLRLAPRLKITGFAARVGRDAVVDANGAVTSLPATGLHRNTVEIGRKNRLAGTAMGGSVVLSLRRVTLGLSTVAAALNDSLPIPSRAYQYHRFAGRTWTASSAFWRIACCDRFVVSGEVAVDDDRTPAALIVARAKAGRKVDVWVAWRDYPASYNAVLGAPLSATSSGGNERGMLLAARFSVGRNRLTFERDVFRQPWLQSTVYSPAITDSWRIEVSGQAANVHMLLRADFRRDRAAAFRQIDQSTRRFRARIAVDATKNVRATADMAVARTIEGNSSAGDALGQSIAWTPWLRLRLRAGVTLFSTDLGKSSVYLYEPDIPGYLTVASMSGKGRRAYLLVDLALGGGVSASLKGLATRYAGERTIGSGVDRLTTTHQTSVSVAVRLRR